MDTTREMHQHQMETTMKEWGARIDALKAKADKATAEAKVELHKQVEEMGTLQTSAKKHFEEFKANSKDTWKDVKKDVEASWNKLSASVDSLWAKVKN